MSFSHRVNEFGVGGLRKDFTSREHTWLVGDTLHEELFTSFLDEELATMDFNWRVGWIMDNSGNLSTFKLILCEWIWTNCVWNRT
ncbi:hypothetical protein WICPIJ_002999 [Wickerhamomyces pijperi]|uniref:Uncharacterized protein n=1 Tax=Wickerhamomyces pijperi TaxID=599730 RepID=A0A9P8TP95_WICPI|nr:hypothetical protein WICPIJ_002999 [Wickerhamomyces pijperi]